jgi:hypothetical protein
VTSTSCSEHRLSLECVREDCDAAVWFFTCFAVFISLNGLRHGKLTGRQPMAQAEVYQMIRRRAAAAGIATKISCHSFRATGITVYLQNGGKLEVAQ